MHLCLSCFYIDNGSYQENQLVRAHVAQGHDVRVLASTEDYAADGTLKYVTLGSYLGSDGATVTRLPYRRWLPAKVARKLRLHPGVMQTLTDFAPDVIVFHGLAGWEIRTVARYARAHKNVLFYADSHEDTHNSARNFVSREILHKRLYGPVLRSAQAEAEKLLCISLETVDFVHEMYQIPRDRLAFFPLGGHPWTDDSAYAAIRAKERTRLGVGADDILLIQSGKQKALKKLVESLKALAAVPDPRLKLFIAGTLTDEIRAEAEALIAADPRVTFLGWVSAEALDHLLVAADVYLQPGSQSVTMQMSLCARVAVIIDDAKSHSIFVDGNGWLVNGKATLTQALKQVTEMSPDALTAMGNSSLKIACDLLDYRIMATRLLSPWPKGRE